MRACVRACVQQSLKKNECSVERNNLLYYLVTTLVRVNYVASNGEWVNFVRNKNDVYLSK